MSFRISITPSRRAAGRFISAVRDTLLKALTDKNMKSGLTQSDIARTIDVHRSVINRELRGRKDITLGRLAELAFAMDLVPKFELVEHVQEHGSNVQTTSTNNFHRKIEMRSVGSFSDEKPKITKSRALETVS